MTDPSCGITLHVVNVPDGTAHARFQLTDAHTDGTDDLDLYVIDPSFSYYVGTSGSGTSEELVDVDLEGLQFYGSGDYLVFVHGWQTDGPDSNYTLFNWNVPLAFAEATDATPLAITSAPSAAVLGESGTIEAEWMGLDPDGFSMGAISHWNAATPGLDVNDLRAITLVGVNTHG
jgi:hypothetical protein